MNECIELISQYAVKIGIKPEHLNLSVNYKQDIISVAKLENVPNFKIIKINKYIMEVVTIHKINKAVKKKFPGADSWSQFSRKKGFKYYYLKAKIKRYITVLNGILNDIDLEVDVQNIVNKNEE